MNILITGANGMLAQDLKDTLMPEHELVMVDMNEFDICDEKSTHDFIVGERPEVVIHCAAYTNVDKAEDESELAYKVNAEGTRNIANSCRAANASLLYISTDFIFDGKNNKPYTTDDTNFLNPLNIYGKSKLQGEEHVKNICEKYFIVRTSWLYGKYGKNFVSTMLKLAQTHDTLKVVSDQIGRPTYAPHLSYAISRLIETNAYGTYHISNNGQCSWYDFAKEIFKIAELDMNVEPITSQEYGNKAVRPQYSVMDLTKIESLLGYEMKNWRCGLEDYIKAIKKQ